VLPGKLLATNLLGKRLFQVLESWFMKFPFIRQIYVPAKQIVNSFASKDRPAFKKVVLVEYPSKGIWSIGFLTNEKIESVNKEFGREMAAVFVPNSPGPLTGYVIFVPKQEIKFLDMPVGEALKIIISGGVVAGSASNT